MTLITNAGTLVAYLIGALLGSEAISLVGLLSTILFMIWMSYMPETPINLCIKNKFKAAEKSLQFYHHSMSIDELIKNKDSATSKGVAWWSEISKLIP